MEQVFIHPQKEYDPAGVRAAAREIISSSGVNPKGKSVFIKPSFVYPSHAPRTVGVVTQPPFIRGVVQALNDSQVRAPGRRLEGCAGGYHTSVFRRDVEVSCWREVAETSGGSVNGP